MAKLGDIIKVKTGSQKKQKKQDRSDFRNDKKPRNMKFDKPSVRRGGFDGRRSNGHYGKGGGRGKAKREITKRTKTNWMDRATSFANFGLFYNKYLFLVPEVLEAKFGAEAKNSEKNDNDVPVEKKLQEILREGKMSLKSFIKSRGGKICEHGSVRAHLESYGKMIEELAETYESRGFESCKFIGKLENTLAIGLGNSHPMENGMAFHWSLGVPFIPAESFKGAVRFQFLKKLFEKRLREHGQQDLERVFEKVNREVGEIFGSSNEPSIGKAVFFDVLPVVNGNEGVRLTFEVSTVHFKDYYRGSRFPTEDQQPNPVYYLAVGKGQRFLFVYLVRRDLPEDMREILHEAVHGVLSEHGIGAKTSLGHGRFSLEQNVRAGS